MGNLLKNRVLFTDTAVIGFSKCPDIVRTDKFYDNRKGKLDESW